MVRHVRIASVMLVLGISLCGAYFGARGQDPRLPWPPAPVVPPDSSEESEPPSSKPAPRLPMPAPVTPPAGPAPVVAPAKYETEAPPVAGTGPRSVKMDVDLPDIPPPAPPPPVGANGNVVTPNVPTPSLNTPNVDTPKVSTPPQPPPMPPGPAIKAMPTETPPAPLMVLPPTDTQPREKVTAPSGPAVPPAPVPLPNSPEPRLPAPQPLAPPTAVDMKLAPDLPAPRPVVSAQAADLNPAPASPKPFILVNPIHRRANNTAPLPLEQAPALASERLLAPALPVAQTSPLAQASPLALGSMAPGQVTPQVTIEKRGPTSLRAGEPLQFYIIVRNIGPTTANQIRVEDEVPPGTRVTYADPPPVAQSDRVTWVISALPPGSERKLKIELQAQGGGELVGTTSVVVAATTGTRTRVSQDSLAVTVKETTSVPVGFAVTFEVQVTNHSKQTVTGLVLHGRLTPGLSHPAGKEIEADVGDIGPGVTKTFKMPVTAVQPGRQAVDVKISAHNGLEALGQGTVQVTPAAGAGLSIRQIPSGKLLLDREADLQIEVTNNQTRGMKNVAVLDLLPDGVEFISASDRGLYRPDARLAHWLIDYLAPGQSRILTVRVQPKSAGHFDNGLAVRTDTQQEISGSSRLEVQGVSDLVVKVTDRDSAVEVGKAAVYEISVTNQGSAPATGIQVRATVPSGMDTGDARGPTQYRVDGKDVIFASLAKLPPQGRAVYYVSALAQAPGNQRFRAQVSSDQDVTPIAREERTFVYRD